MKKLLLILFVWSASMMAMAQINTAIDVIYLKNGSIIRGTILEQIIGQSVKVKTRDGNIWVFLYDDVQKITREEVAEVPLQQPQNQYQRPRNYYYSRKEPVVACALSLMLPGLGQIYNGETSKGITFMATTYGCLALAAATIEDNSDSSLPGLFILGSVVSYIWSVVDAPITANRLNFQNGALSLRVGKSSRLAINPGFDYLKSWNGNTIPNSANLGLKVSLSFAGK
jgi:hypothetical protein